MAQPKPYRHYLRYYDISASAYEYYYVTGTTVDNTSFKTELARAPEGWQEYEVGWERGFTYYGMFTSYSTPLKFHKDGALILRYLQYTYGIEAKCELLVEKFNSDTAVFDYETFFIGDLDLSKATDEFDYVVVPIMESGFPAKLKAREDTPYEFAIDGNTDVKFVYSDGLNLQAKLSWAGLPNTSINGYYNPALVSYDHEGTNLYLQQYDHLLSGNSPFILLANNSNISQDIDFVYDYSITIHLDNSVAASSYFWIQFREVVISTNTFVSNTYILNSTYLHAPNLTYTYIGTIQLPYTLSPNRRIEVTYRMWQPVAAAFLISGTDYQLTSNYEEVTAYFVNRYEPSYIQTLKAVDVMQYLIDEIGKNSLGQPDQTPTFIDHTIESQFPSQIVITSGDAIRNLGGSKLKISFSEMCTS